MKFKDDKRNYVIIGLCAIIVMMAIGYAAFSSLLTINGTATSTNSWCLGFDNTKTSTYTVTKGIDTGQSPTGSMSYSGNVCSTTLVPHAELSSVFYQPGDKIEYTLTIKNASSVGAVIKNILVDNQSINVNTAIKKGNIEYIVQMPASTTLASNAETTMKVIAKFQNETDITGPYSGETQTLEIKINAQQDDGTGGMTGYTGSIYRWSTTWLANKGTPEAANYPYKIDDLSKNIDYITEEDYSSFSSRVSYFGKSYYLKHDIVNNEIINSYVCLVYNNSEKCMRGTIDERESSDKPIFNANTQVVRDYQSYYNLPTISVMPSETDQGCAYGDRTSMCVSTGTDFRELYVRSHGNVIIWGSQTSHCDVYMQGFTYCDNTP